MKWKKLRLTRKSFDRSKAVNKAMASQTSRRSLSDLYNLIYWSLDGTVRTNISVGYESGPELFGNAEQQGVVVLLEALNNCPSRVIE